MAGEWIEAKGRALMGSIFPGEWACVSEGVYQGRCPGESAHSKGGADTDCRLFTGYGPKGEKPGAFCLHTSCKGILDRLNQEFRDAIFAKDPNWSGPAAGGGHASANEGVVLRAPRRREAWIPEFDIARLRTLVANVPAVEDSWFIERSPVDPRTLTPGEFLEKVFQDTERVLVFTEFKSQGDFLWEVGRGGYRLSEERGVKAVRSKLPVDGGKEGVWFLCNPVDGQWYPNPRRQGRFSRRSEEAVRAWRYLVLECDEEKTLLRKAACLRVAAGVRGDSAPGSAQEAEEREEKLKEVFHGFPPKWVDAMQAVPQQWLAIAAQYEKDAPTVPGLWRRFLAQLPLDVVAVYSSGGASLHALVRVDQPDKASFDTLLRTNAKRVLPIFGADPGAMTPVRLTRLPGCTRNGKLQKLIWLNPRPQDGVKILEMRKLRKVQ